MEIDLTSLIDAVRESNGRPQTQLELARLTGLTRKQLRKRIQRVRELGLIKVIDGTGRKPSTYELTAKGELVGPTPRDDKIDELLS